jgi:hypothetical protein
MSSPLSALPLSALLDRARQGDALAIAHLLSQSLADQGIVAQGQWQGDQLQLTLEADTAIPQRQVVSHIQRGLQRLGIAYPVESVQVTARQVGYPTADWQTSFGLGEPVGSAKAGAEGGNGGADTSALSEPALAENLSAASQPGASLEDGAALPDSSLSPRPNPRPDPRLDAAATGAEPQKTTLSDTTLVTLAHLVPLISYLVVGSQWLGGWPVFWGGSFLLPWRVVLPLVLLLAKRGGADPDLGPEALPSQAKAALNFQLTMVIAWMITIALMFVLVGFLLVVPLGLLEVVSCIVAAVRASEGKPVRYVGAIRFVR